jgi:sigma-54 dependent transcriptional regulator, acetoin dehydrogenase operon transcriptional activator AcoR
MTDLVRQAREQLIRVGLLGDHSPGEVVPDLIVRSWRRSLGTGVDSDALCQRYSDIDTESMLYRAAEPVLDRWQGQLADTGTTLFLSDRAGSIVARRASDSSARRRLDRVHAAEGSTTPRSRSGPTGWEPQWSRGVPC